MKKTATALVTLLILAAQSATAGTMAELENRIQKLEQAGSTGSLFEKISLSGALEVDYAYTDDSDVSDRTSNDSSSDLDVGTAEIGIEARLHEGVTANLILKGESLDSSSNVFWDEAFFTLAKPGTAFYLVAGKRSQPFGVFENLFITDPITQELYEVNKTGLTIGFLDEKHTGLDISFTVYKGETLVTRVNDAGYGWSRSTAPGYTASNDVSSYILNASLAIIDGIDMSVFFNSEPGDTDRNTTAGAAVHMERAGLMADIEYIGALSREIHRTDNLEYKESAWTASLGYQFLDSLVVAVRYESFDPDKKQPGNLDCRYALAAAYTIFEKEPFACTLMGEFRRSIYEQTAASLNDDELNEVFARIALTF